MFLKFFFYNNKMYLNITVAETDTLCTELTFNITGCKQTNRCR